MSSSLEIVIAGGGSPSHVHPGLALAEALESHLPGVSLLFAGTGRPFERHLVRSAGYNYVALPARPAPHNPIEAVRFVTDNAMGFMAAAWMLREQQSSLVIGLGGFASAATVRAAVGRGIPTVLMEQNAVTGRTTRWLSGMVESVCTGFSEVNAYLSPLAEVVHTGTPSRPQFLKQYRQRQQKPVLPASREPRLVILGGASGAQTLNQHMPQVVAMLGDELKDWRIVHQTGEGQLQATEARYPADQSRVLTVSYIDELASLLFETDIVVCRAGGNTLAELALAGVPAVVVPYPDAAENHQMANARVYAEAGACVVVDEWQAGARLTECLATEIRQLVASQERRNQMREAMETLARPNAADDIARRCCEILDVGFLHAAA
ncbi:UDP-N-acetylglucosamine--N-acetylmuramyl-(pentapeptide) pyrophosphoryl-undecaprenol N-acetylglucosamine transferase [Aeoliella mucimassa]|uniref:UDP-N-acetylglucosamine--N-acetylmuramyl-(pentapeptide) pyrophosphoryl-undecaprenol N-acetylglucosamine transferase n=1 Tax=Aeoliella mucimassa TaxID=2527972 RepID=A0A518ATC8_9BACT|nr:UDP-N-acetylglucosamine--N-acetylmuramyl-(pentapeptide) pyrophosphoryl-undecaprenol N-acetylglucosamine transferase [Aeoliella mucimassa]QDU57947.1 UDP-N-acetylglucosamine--N-acetylmuramyl-(pentapeptide) pyrophosphoryl-undecaprenol N-acetylglucosamine transferase MurG [Aeoliella mucimassa]